MSLVVLVANNLPIKAGDIKEVGSILRWGRYPGEGYDSQLQYSCLKNSMHRGYSLWGCRESDSATNIKKDFFIT